MSGTVATYQGFPCRDVRFRRTRGHMQRAYEQAIGTLALAEAVRRESTLLRLAALRRQFSGEIHFDILLLLILSKKENYYYFSILLHF